MALEPPRPAQRLLRRVLPASEADIASGELREDFLRRAAGSGE